MGLSSARVEMPWILVRGFLDVESAVVSTLMDCSVIMDLSQPQGFNSHPTVQPSVQKLPNQDNCPHGEHTVYYE